MCKDQSEEVSYLSLHLPLQSWRAHTHSKFMGHNPHRYVHCKSKREAQKSIHRIKRETSKSSYLISNGRCVEGSFCTSFKATLAFMVPKAIRALPPLRK